MTTSQFIAEARDAPTTPGERSVAPALVIRFFFKQKTAYEIGLGIPAEPLFRSGDSSKKFKIAEGQWYRYAPSYVSPAYHLLEGFPFIQEPPSGDLQERVLIRHHDYDQCFQSVQLLQWNSQVKFNVTV